MGKLTTMPGGGGGVSSDETNTTAAHVLSGDTYLGSDTNDEVGTGTMPNRGAVTQSLNAGGSYVIPEGYHNGQGRVNANSLASQTGGATATDGQVLSSYTYWKDGAKRTGTMANQGAKTASLNAGGSYTIPAGYHNGQGRITANSLSSQTTGNIAANRMLRNYVGWANGTRYVGTIDSMAGGTYKASSTQQTISCSGKYMTSNIIIQPPNVQSILSFSFASRNYATANFKWQNPSIGPFYGVVIRGKAGSYPTSVNDGTLIYNGSGTNKAASGTSYSGFKSCGTGTWYFRAFSYMIMDGSPVYHSTNKTASATFNCYKCSNCSDCDDSCSGYCSDRSCSQCDDCGCHGPGECMDCSQCSSNYSGCDHCGNCGDCDRCRDYPPACSGNS